MTPEGSGLPWEATGYVFLGEMEETKKSSISLDNIKINVYVVMFSICSVLQATHNLLLCFILETLN